MIKKIEKGIKDLERIQTPERRTPRNATMFHEGDVKTICTLMTSGP